MNVYIPGTGFATQGPCADGYHVPTYDDWNGLKVIMQGMSISSSDSKIMLHLPYTGFRDATSGNISSQGTVIRYWSATHYNAGSQDSAYYFANYSIGSAVKCVGFSIRPFKDEFVTPDLNWTVVSGTLGSAGIFRNQTDGIISITGNGTTGYTIADKNCGATTVWSDGDTLSEANCGKYYQRGNNYGFAWAGALTTSSTQVNASSYGPGNYYYSSTFITNSSSPQIWDTSYNKNLRGGIDGNVQVVNELKNGYIGEYIEETYHINTSSNLNIYKSGNIINSIVLSGTETGANNQSSEDVHRITVADSTGTYQNGIQLYCSFPSKYGTNVYFQIIKLQNASSTILYTSPYWYTGQLVAAEYELTITRTGWNLRVGTNTASGTFDSSMESIIETLFNGSSVYVIHKKSYGYSTGVDAKVIYGTA